MLARAVSRLFVLWFPMRIACAYHGVEKTWEIAEDDFVIGRAHENSPLLLDLSPDKTVSRVHARIWKGDGCYWIEDQQSASGTLLNEVEIKGSGKRLIQPGDVVAVGETKLRIESLESRDSLAQTNYLQLGGDLFSEGPQAESRVRIARDLDATRFEPAPPSDSGDAGSRRLKLICEMPLQFAAKSRLEELLTTIVNRLAELIPNAESWALTLREPETNALLLKAYRAKRGPHVSEALARRAMAEGKAFIWNRAVTQDLSRTVLQSAMTTGMYAPLLWQGEALGIICAESGILEDTFAEEDLRLIVFMAQYAAMAVGSYQLQEKLRRESILSAKLLRQFSPKVAERMLIHKGRLQLGGERTEVAILNTDLRGFTQLSRDMDPDDIVEMLNAYFAVQVPILFAYQGTIDKFTGDGVLAVFGSPEPDAQRYEHAVLAAVEMRAELVKVNERRRQRGLQCADIGIGIHCGEVVHGFVGTSDRMEYTVIGEAVNLAARYCSAASKNEVLISPEMHERLWRLVQSEQTMIQTKHEGPFLAYRVTGVRPAPDIDKGETAARRAKELGTPPA